MSNTSKQKIFEDFQKSLDNARLLIEKLAPEHYYFAFERCMKLQKSIFKRACGCISSENFETKSKRNFINETNSSLGMYCMNFPKFICGSPAPFLLPNSGMSSAHVDVTDLSGVAVGPIVISRLVLLRRFMAQKPPEPLESVSSDQWELLTNVVLPNDVSDILEHLLSLFNIVDANGDSCSYSLCVSESSFANDLKPLVEPTLLVVSKMLRQSSSALFIRPELPSHNNKRDSSLSPASFQIEEQPQQEDLKPQFVNSFIQNSLNDPIMDETMETADGDSAVMASASDQDIKPQLSSLRGRRPSGMSGSRRPRGRRCNWNVMLGKLHESGSLPPVERLRVRGGGSDGRHELLAIPPTAQKLRPTKRCQLCLRAYQQRKESRYFCSKCNKGFHVRCFEVYHERVGCPDYGIPTTTTA